MKVLITSLIIAALILSVSYSVKSFWCGYYCVKVEKRLKTLEVELYKRSIEHPIILASDEDNYRPYEYYDPYLYKDRETGQWLENQRLREEIEDREFQRRLDEVAPSTKDLNPYRW